MTESQSARSWQSKRVRNARLMGESRSANSPTTPGKTIRGVPAAGWPPRPGGGLGPCGRGRSGARRRWRRCRGSGEQPGAVGAQGVGQHERVEPVVLVPGRAVAAAQVVDLVGADTTTVRPASSRVSTTGPSPRSIATSPTRARRAGDQLAQSGGVVVDGPRRIRDRGHRPRIPRDHHGPSRFHRYAVDGSREGCLWQTSRQPPRC